MQGQADNDCSSTQEKRIDQSCQEYPQHIRVSETAGPACGSVLESSIPKV
eukprot:m.71705 g.71705  ORF g.71705 m.71705 type:complete len:50 (-) comp50199_c0_seq4:1026-1175(-)